MAWNLIGMLCGSAKNRERNYVETEHRGAELTMPALLIVALYVNAL